jgi:hypothetical protein
VTELKDRYFTCDVDVVNTMLKACVYQELDGCGERASAVQ